MSTRIWPSDDEIIGLAGEHGSVAKVARSLTLSPSTLKDHINRRGLRARVNEALSTTTSSTPTSEEVLQAELRDLRRRVNKQRSIDVQAERVLQDIQATIRPVEPMYDPPKPSSRTKKYAQALILSDLHCGEVIVSEAVNGLNEFNWEILQRRVAHVEKSLLAFQRARPYPIDELQVWLLGDNLSGNIHEELAETNEFGVAEQAWRVGSLIAQFIEHLVPHFPKIIVKGVAGNHPRIGKPHSSKQVFDSFDWLGYKLIETHLGNYRSVSCDFPRSGFTVAEIAGLNMLLWHGDGVRSSMPGVPWGGVMRRWNELRKQYAQQGVHLDGLAVGHFHQANIVGGQVFMNGSLCGLNEYGLKNFGSGEKPTQLLLTFQEDKHRLTDVSFITPA